MTQPKNSGIGEQALNKTAEIGISSQFKQAENLDIDVDSEPSKLVHGELDSVTVRGEGLVTPQNLRLEEIILQTDSIDVDVLSAALGKIELTQPTDASARLVFTEADLNHSLSTGYLHRQLRDWQIWVNNQWLTLEVQQLECTLPGNEKVGLEVGAVAHLADKTEAVTFSLILNLGEDGEHISLEQFRYLEGKDLPIAATAALVTRVSELLSLRHLQLGDSSLHIEQIEVKTGKLMLWVEAHIEQIP